MKSPFPGMDPYLEQYWREIHASLIIYCRDQLREKLPDDLRCRVEERVFVSSNLGVGRSLYPDIRIVEGPSPQSGGSFVSRAIATAEPLVFDLEDEPTTETFLEIIDVSSGNKVITVLEVLSQANKFSGPGQEKYLQKQEELRQAGVSLVEIDLLRTGQRVQVLPEYRLPPQLRTPYRVCVRRGWQPARAEFYAIPLTHPLPAIKVPLRQTDADAVLELQPLIEQCYRQGRYDDIDYSHDPEPPLNTENAAWANALLRQAGKRLGMP